MDKKNIVIISPNPTIDYIFTHQMYRLHNKHFFEMVNLFAGGSGINVIRGLRSLNLSFDFFTIIGGHSGQIYKLQIEMEKFNCNYTESKMDTRIASIIDNYNLKKMIVSPSPSHQKQVIINYIDSYIPYLESASLIFFGGSFQPKHCNLIIESLKNYGEKLIIDTRGDIANLFIKLSPRFLKVTYTDIINIANSNIITNLSTRSKINSFLKQIDISNDSCLICDRSNDIFCKFENKIVKIRKTNNLKNRYFGRGDSFMAGVMYGLLKNYSFEKSIKLGNIARKSINSSDYYNFGLGYIDSKAFHKSIQSV